MPVSTPHSAPLDIPITVRNTNPCAHRPGRSHMLSVSFPLPAPSLRHRTQQRCSTRTFPLPREALVCLTCWPLTCDFFKLEGFATVVGKSPQTRAYLRAAAPPRPSPLWDPAHAVSSPCSVLLQASPMSSQKLCL